MTQHIAGQALSGLGVLVTVALAIFLFYLFVRFVRRGFGRLGLPASVIGLIMWGSLIGSAITFPLIPFGDGYLGINLGGAIVPIIISVALIAKRRVALPESLVGISLVAASAYMVTSYDPGLGVYAAFPYYLIPPVVAAFVAAAAYWQDRPDSAGLAYIAGSLGSLIGADIVRLPEILSGPAPEAGAVLAIGGAGVFDMVFLSGILAVAFEASGILRSASERLEHSLGRDGMEAQELAYDQWVHERGLPRNRARNSVPGRGARTRAEPAEAWTVASDEPVVLARRRSGGSAGRGGSRPGSQTSRAKDRARENARARREARVARSRRARESRLARSRARPSARARDRDQDRGGDDARRTDPKGRPS